MTSTTKLPPVTYTKLSLAKNQILPQLCCERCGAVVTHGSRQRHIRWHAYLEDSVAELVAAIKQLQRRP